ncbi:MAG: UvrD-helicase domain-containing protein, partial [Elusimicrobia bacterium]|nr:UvrD-helicase domain-containing protein [Elusimicrobiota bacterium]
MIDDPILEGLNPAQGEAVLHDTGPLLIVAGAGTGKTSVITRRIAHLIATKKALPREILALTFTDKAAAEMEERVDVLVPYGFNDVWISTFHAFGDRVLREQALEVGLSLDFQVLTRPEAAVFLRQHLFELPLNHYRPLGNPTRYLHALLALFSRAKDEDVSPEEYLAYAARLEANAHSDEEREETRRQRELAEAYQTYEVLKAKEGLVDFGDQVLQTLNLFRRRPSILKSYQERFNYILVDEFQDTNYAQFELVKLLATRHRNLVVVGDDDQAVFKFRGACLSNILQFLEQYRQARQIVLTENYRSTQAILDAAYRLIMHNNPERLEVRQHLDKRLHAQRAGGMPIQHQHFDTLSSEAEAVARSLQDKVQRGEVRYRACAILVRANDTASPFLKALNGQGIPWRFSGASGLYAKEEIRLLLAFLRTIADPYDSASLHYLASSPLYGVPPLDLTRLDHLAYKSKRPLMDILQRFEQETELMGISPEGAASLTKLRDDLVRYLKEAQERTASEVLYLFLKLSGILAQLARSEASLRDVEQAQNIAQFFEQVRRFSDIAEYDRVGPCVEYLDTLVHAGDDPPASEVDVAADEVQVLTLHKAKGLEFDIVFLVGVVEGKFPAQDRSEPIPLPDPLVRDILTVGDIHLQ